MKIDIKEVIKITLEPDEMLVINVNSDISQESLNDLAVLVKAHAPKSWGNRVLITGDNVTFSKVKAKS